MMRRLAGATLALAIASVAPTAPARATPINVPIVITDCTSLGQASSSVPAICASSTVTCGFNAPLVPGEVIIVMQLDDPADTGISYGLSGQSAQLFAVAGSSITAAATLNPVVATTYAFGVQSIPAVNFVVFCGPTATAGPQPP